MTSPAPQPQPDGWPAALPRAPEFIRRAAAALAEVGQSVEPAEPLRATFERFRRRRGETDGASALLEFWSGRVPGNARGATRYRWELSHRVGVPMPGYAASVKTWRAWRKGESASLERDPYEVEARLHLPILLSENLEFLARTSSDVGSLATIARQLLEEAAPVARRDVARYVAMNDAWEDTFALWCITRAPRTLELLHPLAVAIAVSYAAGRRGPVVGARFPYYDRPLVSATAQLAAALLTLGLDIEIAGELARFVDAARRDEGWGDDTDAVDPLTTLVAADLLARSDPSFDLVGTLSCLHRMQDEDGLWRALGPDAPWLTGQIIELALASTHPFAERFRWPHCGPSAVDQKTGLPFFAHFLDVAALMAHLPGLAASMVPLAFIDLIGFRAFNNRHGQDAGDVLLRAFAEELGTVPTARAIRDGGDEFLVVGAPERPELEEDLRSFMARWLTRFTKDFGNATAVVPRIVVDNGRGAELRIRRERHGRAIMALKELASVPEAGVLVTSAR